MTFLILVLLSDDHTAQGIKPMAQTVDEATCAYLRDMIQKDPHKPANVRAMCVKPPVGA